jgi:hypothetical protein
MSFDRAGQGLASRIFGSEPARRLALIKSAWPFAVGPELARRTEVLALEGRTLRVRVPDAGWRKALHRMQPQIVARLRSVAGDLGPSRLGFSEGQVAAPAETKPAPSAGSGETTRLDPELTAAAERIADAELRQLFLAAAVRYLSGRRGRS